MQIHVHKDGQQFGPYTIEQLREYVQQGYFTAADHACHDGQNWVTIGQVPGFAAAAQAQPQQVAQAQQVQAASQPQQQVAQTQATAAAASAATAGAAGKKKNILFSSIGAIAACLIVPLLAGVLAWYFWPSDEESSENGGGSPVVNADGQESETNSQSSDSNSASSGSTPKSSGPVALIDRMPSNALGAIIIDIEKILAKGGEQAAKLIPPEAPPLVSKILKDPSTIGLDSAVPLQMHLLKHPTKADEDPIFCLAGKLKDAEKLKNTFEVLSGEDLKQREGYAFWVEGRKNACLAITDEYFAFVGGDDRRIELSHLNAEIERFVNADGTDSFLKANAGFQDFLDDKHDVGLWVNGDSLLEVSPEEVPSDITSLFKGGAGAIAVDFEDGEASIEGELILAKDAPPFGRGGLSYEMTRMIPAKALAALSLALDMKAVESYVDQVVLPAARDQGEEIDLDEVVPELGIKPRDVLQTFLGEFSLAVTEISMAPESSEDSSEGTEPDSASSDNPFGAPPSPDDSNGDSPPDFPFPGEGPGDGPPIGGPGMGGGIPEVEFLFAAKVDPAKWEIVKKAPPVGMVMGLAMLQGISISVEKSLLVIASKKHVAEGKAGTVNDNVSGPQLKMFQENDFALKFDMAGVAKLSDTPVPPPVLKTLEKFSYVAITGSSDKKGGAGALRIGFADKSKNSLSAFMELIPMLQAIGGGGSDLPAEVEPPPGF